MRAQIMQKPSRLNKLALLFSLLITGALLLFSRHRSAGGDAVASADKAASPKKSMDSIEPATGRQGGAGVSTTEKVSAAARPAFCFGTEGPVNLTDVPFGAFKK